MTASLASATPGSEAQRLVNTCPGPSQLARLACLHSVLNPQQPMSLGPGTLSLGALPSKLVRRSLGCDAPSSPPGHLRTGGWMLRARRWGLAGQSHSPAPLAPGCPNLDTELSGSAVFSTEHGCCFHTTWRWKDMVHPCQQLHVRREFDLPLSVIGGVYLGRYSVGICRCPGLDCAGIPHTTQPSARGRWSALARAPAYTSI